MIITIDTNKDRKEDLLAAIELLKNLAGKSGSSESPVSEDGGMAFGSMFGDDPKQTPPDDKEPRESSATEILTY